MGVCAQVREIERERGKEVVVNFEQTELNFLPLFPLPKLFPRLHKSSAGRSIAERPTLMRGRVREGGKRKREREGGRVRGNPKLSAADIVSFALSDDFDFFADFESLPRFPFFELDFRAQSVSGRSRDRQ